MSLSAQRRRENRRAVLEQVRRVAAEKAHEFVAAKGNAKMCGVCGKEPEYWWHPFRWAD